MTEQTQQSHLEVTRFLYLTLSLLFYTGIGFLFIVPSIVARVLALLIMIIGAGKTALKLRTLLIAIIAGILIGLLETPYQPFVNLLSWGSVVGAMLISIDLYEDVFKGSDVASLAVLFPGSKKIIVAVSAYYAFKIKPELEKRLKRIFLATKIYGVRRYPNAKLQWVRILPDSILTYFLESLDIMFSQERVMHRRQDAVIKASKDKRTASPRILFILIVLPLIVVAGYWLP